MEKKTYPKRKIPVNYIILERHEGPTSQCDKPITVKNFKDADSILYKWSSSAPKTGGYDKIGYTIVWRDGTVYKGRYDLKHYSIEFPYLSNDLHKKVAFGAGKTSIYPTKNKNEDLKILKHYQLS